MTVALTLLSSLATALLVLSAVLLIDRRVLRRELATALGHERLATERLVNARKDGYEIPSPEAVAGTAAPEARPLSPALQALIDDWDSDTARFAQLREIRRLLGQGMGEAEVVRRLSVSTELAS